MTTQLLMEEFLQLWNPNASDDNRLQQLYKVILFLQNMTFNIGENKMALFDTIVQKRETLKL